MEPIPHKQTEPKRKFAGCLLILLAPPAVLTLIVGWVWFGWGYIASNRLLLNSLPVPPEAERIWVGSSPYIRDEQLLSPPSGWGTRAAYRISPDTTRKEIVDFYMSNLSQSWEACMHFALVSGRAERITLPAGSVIFIKERAYLSIDTYALSRRYSGPTYEIYVDHERDSSLECASATS